MSKASLSKEARLTAERVRELFNYDPETGVFTRRVGRRAGTKAGDIAGSVKPSGYRSIWIGANYMAHRLAWLYVHGTWPDGQVDHINQIKTDNRLANLRVVTHAQNMENRLPYRTNSTGLRGVYRRKTQPDHLFYAAIKVNRKTINLGAFRTAEEAHAAYCAAAAKLHTHNPAANDSHRSAA